MRKGLFITAEGGEGAGKTSALSKIYDYLIDNGYDVVMTREPGGIKISEEIRSVILNEKHTEMDGRTEALLYAAARRQHLVEKIVPALEEGKIVLCDRFIDSSLAYQGFARGIGFENILMINKMAIDEYWPDLTLYFRVDPEVGLARIAKDKGREVNRLDQENETFHKKVLQGYDQLTKLYKDRIQVVNANESFESVYSSALLMIEQHLEKR
ncbi:dTMP kinase [Alkalihalobacterium chitinilyticum]|uniref:Thymidylate kinase n=1 Tax=Alkalihalobacterium chitinilyticum TaxID=2980103 RepID=A0ABT5VKP3_9BACI|nr:dTMP kinase [Alkalihalobacterium chitinilyticum]MDE5416018.1 dTMP kinase [Alkalihalobacterium chitinilyticum]